MFWMNWIENYIKAGCPEISKEQLALLANSDSHKIRIRLAKNPATPKGVLEYLSKETEPEVRLAVATNRSSPPEIIKALAHDADPTVRHGLAEDSCTPVNVLKMLSDDSNPYVSCRARRTMEALGLLAREPAESDRVYLWSRANLQRYA